MVQKNQLMIVKVLFVFFIFLNGLIWFSVRDVKGEWAGVPPVPSETGITAFFVGDQQFAYRAAGLMLQNLGETGGHSMALKQYDYRKLARWFFLSDALDAKSDFAPFLAAFYYGAVRDHDDLRFLLDYLKEVGIRPGGQKWRWLAQAVYLARFQMNDLDKALELADTLAQMDEPGMPAWTKQMPAFILNAKGSKEEALAVMLEILKSNAETMHPNEVNFTRDYICTRLLDEAAAKHHPLCQDIP